MDGALLFLNSARPFSMPDILGTSTATNPSDMLQEQFNPLQGLVGKGKVDGQKKNCNTYISTFKESIQAKSVKAVFDRQYVLLQCKKEIAHASLIGGNRASKKKNNATASKILMANIYKERDALIEQAVAVLEEAEAKERNQRRAKKKPGQVIEQAVAVLEEAEAKERNQRRAKKKPGQVVAEGEKDAEHEGPQFRKTFSTAGRIPFDKHEFLATMTDAEEDCAEPMGATSREERYRYQLAAQEVYYYLEHPEMAIVYEHSIQQGPEETATSGWQQNPDQLEVTHTSI
jgi:predicted kinase